MDFVRPLFHTVMGSDRWAVRAKGVSGGGAGGQWVGESDQAWWCSKQLPFSMTWVGFGTFRRVIGNIHNRRRIL